jgi:hypothetical protein
MIKSGQLADISKAGFHYITAITKTDLFFACLYL